jgi:galactokinase
VVRSPGRVNLIGEHTDYNEGFVLPAAIDKAAYVAVGRSADAYCHWVAADLNDTFDVRPDELTHSAKGWPNYLMGVVEQFRKAGYPVEAFNCIMSSDVPVGAGMSSSAALECAVAYGLSQLYSLNIPRLELVKMAQRAENEFVGVKSGIMDQFASVFGKKNHVVRLDCRSLEYAYFPFQIEGIRVVLSIRASNTRWPTPNTTTGAPSARPACAFCKSMTPPSAACATPTANCCCGTSGSLIR